MPVVRGEKGARPTASPSPYFDGPKPSANAKPKKVALPPILNPAADHRFDLPPKPPHHAPVPKAVPVNTARLEPATKHGNSKRFYQPLRPGQKPSGYEAVGGRPGRAGIGSPVTSRPYWLATRGPTGDTASQLNPAQLAAARQAGVHPTVAAELLASTVHPLTDLAAQAQGTTPFHLGGAASDVANIASNLVPAGKVGAAGLFGLRGLRALKDAKVGVDVAESAKAAASAVPRAVPQAAAANAQLTPVVFHGTPSTFQEFQPHAGAIWFTDNPKYASKMSGPHAIESEPHTHGYRPQVKLARLDIKNPLYMDRTPRVAELEQIAREGKHDGIIIEGGDASNPGKTYVVFHGSQVFPPYEAAAKVAQEPQDVLRATFKGARNVRGKQEAGYSAERAKRAAAANEHLSNQALPPDERLRLAKQELKGELPKIDFQGMNVLDDQALAKLQTHILDHPHLMPFQKITASTALANAVAGKVPTKSELTLLEHVFGKTTADSLGQIHNHPFKNTLLGVLNVPRSLMASFDLSAPFRQGLVVSIRHPTVFARNFKPMLKAFGSEKVYHAMLDEIHTRPTYPMMMEAKLSLTELGGEIGKREEQFGSDLAETLTGGKKYSPVRMSGRAYTGFLDKTRADVFDHLIGRAQAQGVNVQDTEFLKHLGRYINSATGRGPLFGLEGAAPALNAVFFSPRLLMSRLDLIFSPISYAKTDPFVRREALKSMIAFAGTLSTLLAVAAQAPGVKVVLDPRNPDWGKIRVGNTRVDIGGGFQQPLRLFAQLATGTAISSTTGKKLNLTAGGFGQPNRLDLFLRFFEGKESPIASLVTDYMRNSNQVGQKFTWRLEVSSRLIPLLAQDSYDLYHAKHGGMNGIAAAFAGYAIGSVGFGIQNYGPRPPKGTGKAQPSYFSPPGAGGAGGGYFAPPSQSGAGGGYFK